MIEMNKEDLVINTADIIKKMNLWQRIHAVSTEVGRVSMTLEVDAGKGRTYKAVSINDVVDSLVPVLEKYRLVVVPSEKEIIEQMQVSQKGQYGDKTQFYIRLKATYKVVNIDKPDEFLEVSAYGDGIDSGDKATGKANTYARKYALIDAFNLSKGDDPDKEASKEYAPVQMAKTEQVEKVKTLYSDAEILTMIKRLKKKDLYECTSEQVERMIAKRDRKELEDASETF